MPPALSDDEMSDASAVGAVTTPPPPVSKRGRKPTSSADSFSDGDESDRKAARRGNGRVRSAPVRNGAAAAAAKVSANGSEDDEDSAVDDEDDEGEEEEYEVQEIIGHVVDKDGKPRFRVVWKGYENPNDHTWEPAENLEENASEILNEYIARVGGPEALKEKPGKGKKRGRPAASRATPTSTAKRSRKSEEHPAPHPAPHPADRESPAAVPKAFKPPAGSWEDEVVDVEMFRGDDGELRVFLTWKNGQKTQHAAQQTYLRCPQRILRFYESRISFKTPTE